MKNSTTILAILLTILTFTSSQAQTNGQVIASGKGYSYILDVPAGWESAWTKAEEQHLKVILVPNGGDWENSKTVMYSNVVYPNTMKGETIFDIIDFDISMYKMADPDMDLEDGDRIMVNRGQGVAMVIKIMSPATGNYQAIAYINEGDKIPFVVLSSLDKESFDRDYPMFEQLVSSYKFYANEATAKAE